MPLFLYGSGTRNVALPRPDQVCGDPQPTWRRPSSGMFVSRESTFRDGRFKPPAAVKATDAPGTEWARHGDVSKENRGGLGRNMAG